MSVELIDPVIQVLQVVCRLEHIKLPPNIDGTTNLRELGLNSLLFIKFVVRLEVEFDVDFDDESMDIDTFITINDIAKYIEERAVAE